MGAVNQVAIAKARLFITDATIVNAGAIGVRESVSNGKGGDGVFPDHWQFNLCACANGLMY